MTLRSLEFPGPSEGEKSELLLSPTCTIVLLPDETSRDAFNEQLHSTTAINEKQKRLLHFNGPATLGQFNDSLQSLALAGRDDWPVQRALEAMKEAAGPSAEPDREHLEKCRARLEEILLLRKRFNECSGIIFKLQEKRQKIGQKLTELGTFFAPLEESNAAPVLEKSIVLPLSLNELDDKIRLLREKKENITRRASELKGQLKEYEEYLNASEQVVSIICDYETTEEAIETTLAEKEKLKAEISEKEKEILRTLEIYQTVFMEFQDPQDFNAHMDSLEEKLSEARVMNEKKAELQSCEMQSRNLRVTEWLCLLPSTTLILFNFALLYVNGLMLDDYLRVVMIMTFMLGICCLAGFIKSFQSIIAMGKTIARLKQEITDMKSSIDAAKAMLLKMQKHYGSITSTELRVKFKEYQSLLVDLDNVRKLMTSYSSAQTMMDTEKGKLEANVRIILEKCGILQEGREIDSAVIAEFRQNHARARELNREIEQVALLYKDVVEEIGREQGKKSELQKERQNLEKTLEEMSSKVRDKEQEANPEMLSELFLMREEENAALSDYEAEIAHLESLSEEFQEPLQEMPSLEEEIAALEERIERLENDRKALEEILGTFCSTTEHGLKGIFYPALREKLDTILEREEWQFVKDRDALLRFCDYNTGSSPEETVDTMESSLVYALYRALAIGFITDGKAEVPLIIEEARHADGKEHLPGHMKFLLALSKVNQVIYVTMEKDSWNSLKEVLTELRVTFKESASGAPALLCV